MESSTSEVNMKEQDKVVEMQHGLWETFTTSHWTVSQGDQWNQWILDSTLRELIEEVYEWMNMTCIVLKVYKKKIIFWKCVMDVDCNYRPIYLMSAFDDTPKWQLLSAFSLKTLVPILLGFGSQPGMELESTKVWFCSVPGNSNQLFRRHT